MQAKGRVLFIHRDASPLRRCRTLLRRGGYEVLSAASARAGLRVLETKAADAVVLDDGAVQDELAIAAWIKHSQPRLPVIMMADHVKLPAASLRSVDAWVAKADPPEFLLATLHFLLQAQPAQERRATPKAAGIDRRMREPA